jgi:hypothetical protein
MSARVVLVSRGWRVRPDVSARVVLVPRGWRDGEGPAPLVGSGARSGRGQTRGFSFISIVSISSPIWMSLNLPRPMPAS